MFDGLVGGTILAQADAVVGEYVDHAQPHHRRQADAGAHVVAENEEGAAVGDDAAVKGQAAEDSAHAVLAHAEA